MVTRQGQAALCLHVLRLATSAYDQLLALYGEKLGEGMEDVRVDALKIPESTADRDYALEDLLATILSENDDWAMHMGVELNTGMSVEEQIFAVMEALDAKHPLTSRS